MAFEKGHICYNTKKDGWKCSICGEIFRVRRLMTLHRKEVHKSEKYHNTLVSEVCQFCGRSSTTRSGLKLHEKSCSKNPNRVNGMSKGRKMTDEQRRHCSEARKRVIAQNGGVWWNSRSNCKRSYAEEWTLRVIQNEFLDQNFKEEYHLNRWFMDFAWPDKKRYIEIDGAQHEWPERKKMDEEKDSFYKSLGWEVLRLSWKYITNNTQQAIKEMKDFIDNAPVA